MKKIFLNCSVYILEFLSKNLFINMQILFYLGDRNMNHRFDE